MIINRNPILALCPRHEWLKNRVIEVIKALNHLESIQDWEAYRITALDLSKELNYATVEWERYYHDNQFKTESLPLEDRELLLKIPYEEEN